MYESFYGFSQKPFSLLPDPKFLYMSRKHAIALSLLEYSLLEKTGIVALTGEIGSGKTTLIKFILDKLSQDVAVGYLNNTHPSMNNLLEWVLMAYGIRSADQSRVGMYTTFVNYLRENHKRKMRSILIVDEAQNLGAEMLEEIRLLSNLDYDNQQILQLILVGQPQLRALLNLPQLEQFSQRITMDYFIEPLSEAEVREYIRHRLAVAGGNSELFSDEAIEIIFFHSRGIPRLVNILCDTALIYSFAEQHPSINGEIVREVVHDRERGKILPLRSGQRPAGAETAA
jgi:general secretion pathway protein A